MMSDHPCLSCGACCNFFRVSFHWSETLFESYRVPTEMTDELTLYRNVMTGTDQVNPRCVAFTGVVGKLVGCAIYKNRPGCCRDFKASFEDGIKSLTCDQARAAKGLSLLQIEDWVTNTKL